MPTCCRLSPTSTAICSFKSPEPRAPKSTAHERSPSPPRGPTEFLQNRPLLLADPNLGRCPWHSSPPWPHDRGVCEVYANFRLLETPFPSCGTRNSSRKWRTRYLVFSAGPSSDLRYSSMQNRSVRSSGTACLCMWQGISSGSLAAVPWASLSAKFEPLVPAQRVLPVTDLDVPRHDIRAEERAAQLLEIPLRNVTAENRSPL